MPFRKNILNIVVNGTEHYPLFTEAFAGKLPVVTALLVFAAVKAAAFGVAGERRSTLALDALHGVCGVAAMLYLLRGDPLLQLPPIEVFQHFYEGVNGFLAQLSNLVIAFLALAFGVKTVKRLLRIAQV